MLPQYGQWDALITIQGVKYKGREVILPLPPSENERLKPDWNAIKHTEFGGYYDHLNVRKKRGVLKNSTVYNRWLNAAKNLLLKGKLPQLKGEVIAFVTIVFPDHKRRDGQNRLKALYDCMTFDEKKKSGIYADDHLVTTGFFDVRIIPNQSFVVVHLVEKEKLPRFDFQIDEGYLNTIAERISNENAIS